MSQAWKLVITEGPDIGREFQLPAESPLVIGRGTDSDTQIRDPKMSRIHCEVRMDDQAPLLIDRGGSGGTRVNGETIESPRRLTPGSIIEIGESVLRVEDGSTAFDQDTVRLTTPTRLDDAPPGSITELEGQSFHHYRLGELVTLGRNSAIFQGIDTKRNLTVAVKVLRPQMTQSDEQRERFIRAMKTVLPVKHANIVGLRNAGKKGPYCWAAMDWVEGTSAAKLIESIGIGGTLDWREVYRCGLHIARALVAAAEHGVVHRNITPANILRRDDGCVYMLSDLVFAKALETTEAAQLTKPGDILGELGYLAPERVLDATKLDARSDFFGLGATLYALLTGNSPFPSSSVADWLKATNEETPARPVGSQIGMDERFSDLVMRLIEKDPADRFETAAEVLTDFKRVGTFAGIDITQL
ncbi:MAG: FHA domain-containing serine/threonine-protein kinase [Planctomycetota bacterium]